MESYELTRAIYHLRSAIRNALIVFGLMFVLGMLAGWAAGHYAQAPAGALVGVLIALIFAGGSGWIYYSTRGLL